MGKKHKQKKFPSQETKPNFVEIYWEKIIVILLLILPLIYFASFLSPNCMIAGSDYLVGGYPFDKWTGEQEGMPLWYPHIFGGVPVLGAPVGGPFAPLAQLKKIIPPHVVLALTFIIFFFLAGLGTYLYLKETGLSQYTAAVGAVIYQFIGNLATTPNAGHAGRAASIAILPLMLFFVHRGLKSRKLLYFILTAFVTAFAFYEGHFQITYYGLLFILCYVIYYLIAHRKEISKKDLIRIFGCGLCAIVIIGLLMAAVWLPVLGGLGTAARGIERGYEYATSWAMPPSELIDLLVPTFSGILENYWGTNPFKQHTEYFGLLSLVFAFFALVYYWKNPYVKFYTFGALIVILVSLGRATPFFRIPYLLIPGFKLFRAPALSFYLTSFSLIVLGAIGFENIIIKKELDKKKFFITAGLLLVGFIIIMIISGLIGQNIAGVKSAIFEKNLTQFNQGVFWGLIIILLVLGMIFLSLKQKTRVYLIALCAVVISLLSQLPLMVKFLPKAPAPEVYYASDDVIRFLKKDPSICRVFPSPWYEHATDSYLLYHNIQSAGGYIPNPVQRYQEFIGAGTSVMFRPINLIQHPKFLDMLNIKYIIGPALPEDISRYSPQDQRTILELKSYFSRFTAVYRGERYSVYLNDSVLPRAYIVPDYQLAKEGEVLEIMKLRSYEPRQVVILEENPEVTHPQEKFPMVEAKIISYTANKIVCNTDCLYPGFLVLADNWHPDWKVFVDGEKERLYRANYTFGAVYLDAGKHEVVFEYISDYFNTGKIITIITIILSVCFCLIAVKFKI